MEHKDFSEEKGHLSRITGLIRSRLDRERRESSAQEAELKDARRDDYQERSESVFRNLFAAQRFEDLLVMSEEMQAIANEEKDHDKTLHRISALERMLNTPYFTRIDLAFEEEDEEPERIFIGRASLWDDRKENLLVYDWRAPSPAFFTASARANASIRPRREKSNAKCCSSGNMKSAMANCRDISMPIR